MKNTEWGKARDYVLAYYPKAVCFKYRKNVFVIFSDRNLIKAKRLSKDIPEHKNAINKGMAWIEAKEEIVKHNKSLLEKHKNHTK